MQLGLAEKLRAVDQLNLSTEEYAARMDRHLEEFESKQKKREVKILNAGFQTAKNRLFVKLIFKNLFTQFPPTDKCV